MQASFYLPLIGPKSSCILVSHICAVSYQFAICCNYETDMCSGGVRRVLLRSVVHKTMLLRTIYSLRNQRSHYVECASARAQQIDSHVPPIGKRLSQLSVDESLAIPNLTSCIRLLVRGRYVRDRWVSLVLRNFKPTNIQLTDCTVAY